MGEEKKIVAHQLAAEKNLNNGYWRNIGTKALHLKERSIQECLNCKKPECTGCTIWEKEKPEVKR